MALNWDSKMKCLIHDVLEICIVELRSEHRIAVHWMMLDHFLLNKHTRQLTSRRKGIKMCKSLLCDGVRCL